MSGYVENGYAYDYVEGDNTPSSDSVSCDLSETDALISSLSSEVVELKNIVVSLASELASIKQVSLSLVNSVSSLPSKDYIDSKIPNVCDISIRVLPIGTEVAVPGLGKEKCTVVSSRLFVADDNYYGLMYSVGYERDGVLCVSDFPSMSVVRYEDAVFSSNGG